AASRKFSFNRVSLTGNTTLRLQKRIRLFKGLTLNLSKTGTSFTLGGRGASVNIRGDKVTGNVGIPGTGISYRERLDGAPNEHNEQQVGEVIRSQLLQIMKLNLPSAIVLSILFVNPSYAADIYRIDQEHTFVSFSYSHQNYSVQTSRFDNVSGKVILDKETGTGVIDVEIDMKSVSTGSAVFNKRIQENDFFDTETFPIATLKSEKITFTKDGISSVQGNLTIKGHTKPVSIDVKNFYCSRSLLTLAYTCGANAVTQVKRTDFDMGKYVPFVGDDVTIGIAIEALKE
ncbi:MAG: DUF4236 domain-containing protein, partial [Fluviibacter sp.]